MGTTAGPGSRMVPVSSIGVVLYDLANFREANSRGLPQGVTADQDANLQGRTYAAPGGPPESRPANETDEEKWLDQNAVPYLVNRYNGTLIRGE
jgi:hypothetical protein